ncbi:MAG TPA: PA14 domain-containing protein [Actinophytocola sp.]|uniref:PA14 domain-containing protein n=1 Tax=Actinophytocola sp. TaxID=1872138 RepID=UPI002DDDAA1D|nr:PA14 domain-containing protein [Actinophytocola sp.]HEV2779866.1 PA14 domain-containing protein [Actinophytocola sp.]
MTVRKWAALVLVVSLTVAGMLIASPSHAAPPPDFQTSLIVGDGLDQASGFEIAPDGRIFILERGGKIKVVKNGQLLPTPFADLPSQTTGDRGLIGIAFDPGFGITNHYVYFYYCGEDLLNHLVRFSAAEDVGTDGPYQLFQTQSPSHLLHVGGSIGFGPDGKLYFAVGDNGDGENAQNLSNPHGKILRINSDGTIPADNPFYGQPGKLDAIWAYGFRNPWRFQFDPSTGEMYGGDVGNYTWEELNHIVRAGNYGWPRAEGPCTSDCAGYIDPIHAWNHDGSSSSVTGGPVYRGGMFPAEYQGSLFFGDYAQGWIKRAVLDANGAVASVHDFDPQAGAVTDLKVAPDGSLYYVTYWPAALYRVTYNTASHVPVASSSADVTKGVDPLTVHFSSAGSNDPDGDPLSFGWDFGDGTTSTEPDPTKTYPDTGVYTARLTVTAAGESSIAQPIVVQVGVPPTLTVAAPTEGQLYRAGETINYTAFATDGAGFDLNDAGIKTTVRLRHGTHYHPFVGPLTGRAGSFTIPATGEASADTGYELTVTATDANGLATSKVITIRPRKADLTFATSPPGVPLQLDGVPIAGPHTVEGVAGFQRLLAAPAHAVAADGTPLQFAGWSDGGTIRHTITSPDVSTTYTATYVPDTAFTGQYYDNINLAGTPVLTRQDAKVDFGWGESAPEAGMPQNSFSVRWTKKQWFGSGRYRFAAVADDGVRLYIDNQRVIDHWYGPANVEHEHTADLGEGLHTIRFEFLEYGGAATARLTWDSTVDQPEASYRAEYWNLGAISGPPTISGGAPDLVRSEPVVDHDWGSGSPDPSIGVNLFAARWTRNLNLAPGRYAFTTTADDGVRLSIDGARVIDDWVDQAPTTHTVTLPMDGAPHKLVLEYYEHGAGAVARLGFHKVGDLPDPPAYRAEYWNNPGFGVPQGIPATPAELIRTDEAIDFNWFDGSPAPVIHQNDFIARWTRTDVLSAGTYRFSGVTDDGIRVFVDDVPVVSSWAAQHATFSVDKVLTAGPHAIRVEYFEAGGDATAIATYARIGDVQPEDGPFTAQYHANRDLAGPPALTRQDLQIDFDWGGGSPGDGVPADNFSARWTKSVTVPAGNYRFTTTTDDGVRLFVDGTLVIDRWLFQGTTTYTAVVALTEGVHQIVMEYFEAGSGAVARFGFAPTEESPPPPPPPSDPFTAQYYANPMLEGVPVLIRVDAVVDFDWGQAGSPDPAVPVDFFSARWKRTKDYAAGRYRFTVTGDDGIRLLVDGVQVIDGWHDQWPTTYTADVELSAGPHTVAIEYYDKTGGAIARYSEVKL